jgi:predicted nucleotidyltransferase
VLLHTLVERKLIHPPKWLPDNTQFLGYAGSAAYGVSSDTSDMDCFGFCIPPREIVFPFTDGGRVYGFGTQEQRFRVWSEHHVDLPDQRKQYDFSIYNIVDFFHLAMENNPNILDVLFLPRRCILHTTKIAEHVRENRRLFLHKGAMAKLRGYAYSQMSKIENKTNSSNPKRAATIQEHGFDLKFSYHVVRLMLQCEQILVEHDLDIERNSEVLKSIRRGEWTLPQLTSWFEVKEKSLETLYANSTLKHSPDEESLKRLLLQTLEMHYGTLTSTVVLTNNTDALLADLETLVKKYTG